MSRWLRYLLWSAVLAACLGPLWAFRMQSRGRPDLSRVIALAEAQRFDEAETLVQGLLKIDPSNSEARMLAGQIALNRPVPPPAQGEKPDPGPALYALEQLDKVKPDNPYFAALVELYRGKAEFRLGRLDAAEKAWQAALMHDRRVPEAGWHLLDLFYLEGRAEDSRRLALRLHEIEPDPGDRVRYLLELLRQDTHPPAPASIVNWFRPIIESHPDEIRSRLALAVAQARAGSVHEGLATLNPAFEEGPESSVVWEALLTILDESGEIDRLSAAIDRLPGALADRPEFARYRARVYQDQGNWELAERWYRLALQAAPADHTLQYRLIRILRNRGKSDDALRIERDYATFQKAMDEALAIYDEANAIQIQKRRPGVKLCQRIADLRERMGRRDEAIAWHRLVLSDEPGNALSLAKADELARTP